VRVTPQKPRWTSWGKFLIERRFSSPSEQSSALNLSICELVRLVVTRQRTTIPVLSEAVQAHLNALGRAG
jgi:hypothetical protein